MSSVTVDEPVTYGGLRTTHFFNGRLLTGEDLRREQETGLSRLARLGRAGGDGVVDGLLVTQAGRSTAARPVVTVSAGLAVAPSGVALELAEDTDVLLVRARPQPASEPGGLFADCEPYSGSEYSTGAGVYVLVVGPAAAAEGLAPVSGLHRGDAACTTAWAVEAVTFRLVRLALPLAELDDRSRLRNRVAHRMYDRRVTSAVADPFGTSTAQPGLLSELRRSSLSQDEVPLAVVGWEAGRGISFIDRWAVRRRVCRDVAGGPLDLCVPDRLLADAEARFLQFQEHVADLAAAGGRGPAPEECFERTPPAGLLPVGSATRPSPFHFADFFRGSTVRGPAHVPGARVPAVVRSSLTFPALQLPSSEAVWLYVVLENAQAPAGVRPAVLFASGHVPYAANAQFDLSHWNFANFSLRFA